MKVDYTSALYVVVMVSFCCSQFVPERVFRNLSLAEAPSTVVWIRVVKKRLGLNVTPSSLGQRFIGSEVLLKTTGGWRWNWWVSEGKKVKHDFGAKICRSRSLAQCSIAST